jgi:hypothetical protein
VTKKESRNAWQRCDSGGVYPRSVKSGLTLAATISNASSISSLRAVPDWSQQGYPHESSQFAELDDTA